jgi:outer membrane protein OmpA-like peptidoglycan-associated protein
MVTRMAVALALLMLANGSSSAQELPGEVIDLVYGVEDLGGRVQSLQIKETATETRIELPADILFDFDKFDIRPSAADALKQVGDMLRERAKGTVRIEGHTDSKGAPAYNQTLSERRAASVQSWLVEREGLKTLKFTPQGFAAQRPVAPNSKPDGSDDPEGRQKNRRVEIVFGRR